MKNVLTHTTGTHRLPRAACRVRNEAIRLELEQPSEQNKARTFRILGNTGKKMLRVGYWGALAFDFAGLSYKQQLPALLDHDPSKRVGYSEAVKVAAEGMVFEGKLLQQNEHVQAVLRDADDGFPWQASIMVEPTKAQWIAAGEFVECNGEQVEGPCYVIREGVVREVSFVALGADDDTAADVAASGAEHESVECTFTHEAAMAAPKTTTNENPAGGDKPQARTAADVRSEFPAQVAELSATAVAAAVEATLASERERVQQILANAGEDQLQLAATLCKNGTSLEQALAALLKDARTKLAASRSGSLDDEESLKPAAGGNGAGAEDVDPQGKLRASFPKDERGQKAYDKYVAKMRDSATR